MLITFWAPHSVLIDNFPWYGYTEKQYTYTKQSVIKGLIEIEAYAFTIFILGNLGTRLLGLVSAAFFFFKSRKPPSLFSLTLLIMTAISLLIPLLFLQSGKVFEIIQLAWYYLFFTSLFAAIGFASLFNFKKYKILQIQVLCIIITATLPSTYSSLGGSFIGSLSPGENWSNPYHSTMQFLEKQGSYNQTILEIPTESGLKYKDLVGWYRASTPGIVAFANKKSFLNSEYIDFSGVNIKPRILLLQKILTLNTFADSLPNSNALKNEIKKELIKNKIIYIYSPYPLKYLKTLPYIKQIYQNKGSSVYKVETSTSEMLK